MIDLTGANIYLLFVIGAAFMGAYFWLLSDGVYQKIAESRYWIIGWVGALMVLFTGVKLMTPVINMWLDGAGVNDEDLVPYIIGAVSILMVAMYARHMCKLRRIRG